MYKAYMPFTYSINLCVVIKNYLSVHLPVYLPIHPSGHPCKKERKKKRKKKKEEKRRSPLEQTDAGPYSISGLFGERSILKWFV
jgi:hypothetical protein